MVFKITELKEFLSSINKQKAGSIIVQSKNLSLTINSSKHSSQIISSSYRKLNQISGKNIRLEKSNNKNIEANSQISKEQGACFTIISPMIGTFYRSSAPNEAPFIDINDSVKAKQTVCIIEAMKLMNEIESEVNGDIVEILVRDGDIVDCGQALMKVKQK